MEFIVQIKRPYQINNKLRIWWIWFQRATKFNVLLANSKLIFHVLQLISQGVDFPLFVLSGLGMRRSFQGIQKPSRAKPELFFIAFFQSLQSHDLCFQRAAKIHQVWTKVLSCNQLILYLENIECGKVNHSNYNSMLSSWDKAFGPMNA